MRQSTVLGLLVCILAALSMLAVQAIRSEDGLGGRPFLGDMLGAPKPAASLVRRPADGIRVGVTSKGFQVSDGQRLISLRSAGASSGRWARYSRGVARTTSFGRETVVVTPQKTEQFLTVERRQGPKTWSWRLGSEGLTPRLGDDGSVGFLAGHRLSEMYVEPVAILDEVGKDITPENLRWSLSQDRRGWLLELRLTDDQLPLPYVIDPAVSYRLATPSNNGAAGGTSITMTMPGGVVNNDLLFMHIAARGGNNMTIATPGGWTLLRNTNQGAFTRLATFYRIASGEPASYLVTFGGGTPSQQAVGAITAYYGVKTNTAPGPLDVNGATAGGNNATPTANSISAAANALVLAAYSHGAGNGAVGSQMFTTAAGMNERYDNQSQNATAGNRSAAAMDDILSAAGGLTGNKAVTASASGRWVAHQVSFSVDDVNPLSTTTFPVAAASYNAAGWAAGCAPDGICGTASDNDSSVQQVDVSIRQGAGNYWNGTSFASATEVWNLATGTTTWNYGFTAFPADGSYTVRVRTTDTAANALISSVTFTYDTVAPGLATSLASTPVSPANDNNPEISGTAEAGSTVRVYTTAGCTGGAAATGTAAAFASPGLTVAVADDSSTTFKATATDAAGNVSGCSSSSVTYVEDSIAPALPASLASTPVGPANDNNPEISGTAEAGSTVRVYTTAGCTGGAAATGTAAAFASPGFTIAVADDSSTTFKATATDAAGNVSGCSASSVTYVEDSAAPALPASLASAPASPANNNNPEISGSAEAGSTVRVYTTAGCTGGAAATGTAAAFASPGLTIAVADDSSTTFKATATDAAGNVSGCSASSVTYVEDSTAPGLPGSLASSPVSPANDNNPEISGSAEAGSTVKLYTTSDCSGAPATSGTAAAFSSPGLTVAVADDSSTTFKTTATDAAGNVSGCSSSSVTYVEDSTAPALPASLASTPVGPANENSPQISGSAEAGSTVKLYTTSDCSGAPTTSGTAAAFSSPGLTVAVADDSSTTFKATATDAAGNVSGCSSSSVTYVEDSNDPAAPSGLASTPASPANDNSPKISGTAEAGSTVKLYTTSDCSGAPTASGTAAAFASPGITVSVSDDTTTTFKATATDGAGNTGACSTGVTYVEDSTDPAAPSGLASTPASPANDNSPKISGAAEAGSTVKLYPTSDCSGAPDASGTAAAFSSPGLTVAVSDDSTTSFKATATDAAGNLSACSSAYVYVEDSTLPSSTIGFPSAGGNYAPSAWNAGCASPGFCGTASDGSGSGLQKVEISIRQGSGNYYDGASFSSGSELYLAAAGTASWSYGFATGDFPADGSYTIHVKATDNAGNVESFSSRTFVFDASAPSAPSLLFSAFTNASATGQTVFYRPGVAGGFTVGASSSDPDSGISGYAFPALGAGWSGSQTGASYDYSFNASASDPAEPNNVSAQNNAGLSSTTSFTVTSDGAAPVSSIACDGASCAGSWYTSAVSVSLAASDGVGSGVQEIRYTTDGSDPSPINGTVYLTPFGLGATTTVKFRSYDAVDNEEAVASQLVRIDDSAPSAPALTLSETPASAKQHVSGTTLFYNPQGGNSGAFTVDATTSDPQSGIDKVSFPALAGMTGGGDDFSSPYEGAYSWTASSTASGSQTVYSVNNAGLSTSSPFVAIPDTAPPSTGFVSYPGGYASGSVTITTDDGTDPLSGVNTSTRVLERDETELVGGNCDPFTGAWSTVSSPDATITSGHCYVYRYRVSDNVGNEAIYTSGAVVKVSTGAPSAPDLTLAETPGSANQHVSGTTLFYSATGANSGTFTVAATVADSGGSGVDKVGFPSLTGMTGGGDDTTSPYQGVYDWDATSSASGAHTVTVYNNAGFTSQASFTVTRDTAPPTGQDASIAGGYYTSLSVPVTLQNGTDALSGVDPASGIVERQSGTLSTGNCVAWGGSWSPVTLAGGADTTVVSNSCYRYRYVISDNVGNQTGPSAPSLDAKVDATTPVTSDDAPAGWQNAPVTVTLSVIETGSGIASTVYRVDGGSFQGGTSIGIPAPADHSNDGVHTIEYRSTDNAGNVESLRSATVRIDTTLPTTTDDAPAGWSSAPVTVTLSPADALSGIASTQYRIDGGLFQGGTSVAIPAPADHSNDGVHTIEYRSTDNAGNVEALQTATVRIDTTLPAGALTSPADGTPVNGSVAIAAAASDVPSGVASVEFLVRPNGSGSFTSISTDTTAPYDASWDSTGAPEGNAELKVVVLDNAGLSVTSATRTVIVDNPPTPTLDDPGANVSGTVTLTASSQPDTAQVVFERSPAGAGTWTQIATDATAPFSADLDTTSLLDGNYDLRAVATDGSGFNGTSSLRTSRVDNAAPTVSVSDPASGAVVGGGNVHVAALATDLGSGVASVQFEQRPAGGGAFTAIGTDTTAPYEASWDATGLSGSYELRAVATDAAGNPATAATVTVTVDAAAASVTLSNPGALLRGVVNLSASAPSLAVTSVDFERRPAGGSWTRIALDTARPWGAAFDTKSIGDGVYDLRVKALGSSGQVLAIHSLEGIRVDNTAPTTLSATPANGSVVSSVTSIVLVASEPVSSVQGAALDGSTATAQISGSNVTFATSSLRAGPHALTGSLVDAAGNTGAFSVRFTVEVKAHAKLILRVKKPKTKIRGRKSVFLVPVSLSIPARVQATLLGPTGRRLRTLRTKLSAGGHSLRLIVPTASLPPGRYTILVVATASDGSKVVKRIYVRIPRKHTIVKKRAAKATRSKDVVIPVALPPAPSGDTDSPASPKPRAQVSKPKPKKQPARSKIRPLETASGYVSSKPRRTIGLVVVLFGIGAALAFLIKIEMTRILASPRR